MFQCHVCKNNQAREKLIDEVFQIDSKHVLVKNIPAKVCGRCGEAVFSSYFCWVAPAAYYVNAKPPPNLRLS